MTAKLLLSIAASLGGLGVALGAFGSHYLKDKLSAEMLNIFEIGIRYQMYHVFALFISAWAWGQFQNSIFESAGWIFFIGTLVFSGSLYILALSGIKSWGMVTPMGGVLLLAGWAALLRGFWSVQFPTA